MKETTSSPMRQVCAIAAACLLTTAPATAQEILTLPAEDRPLTPDFEELYRVGSVTGADWEQFGNVRRVGFDGAGRLYVFDSQADRVTVVGPDGEFLRAFGRPGEGPGEFRGADGLAVMRDGRVVLADLGHRAYHIFGADGTIERMVRMAPEPGDVRITDLLPDPGGGAIFSAVGAQNLSVGMATRGRRYSVHVLGRWSASRLPGTWPQRTRSRRAGSFPRVTGRVFPWLARSTSAFPLARCSDR